jgi:hypothetical protein
MSTILCNFIFGKASTATEYCIQNSCFESMMICHDSMYACMYNASSIPPELTYRLRRHAKELSFVMLENVCHEIQYILIVNDSFIVDFCNYSGLQ